MHHDLPLITTIAAALGSALLLGFLAVKLRLPALVGYLVAGILIGPATPGFVADLQLSMELAEIGVMLLMFGVGLHFSVDDLRQVRGIALPGAVLQMAAATAMGFALAHWWGWSAGAGIVFGLSLSVASTVVLLRALESRGVLESLNGRIAIGWLVVEDLAMVLVLVILPAFAGGPSAAADGVALGWTLVRTLGNVAVFVLLMWVLGRRLFPWLLWQVARTGSRELFTLCVIAAAVGVAYGSARMFGVSFALGAFFAGMVLRESALSHRAATESLPLRDAFSVLFFVSVGMLFDPAILVEQPLRVAAVVGIIVFGKTLAALLVVLLLRYPLNTALTVSASLAQIGEFSFILASLGVSLQLLPAQGQSLILAAALISIALNPLLFAAISPVQNALRRRSEAVRRLEQRDDPLAALPDSIAADHLTGHVVLVGYGRVGSRICAELETLALPIVVAEQNRELVELLRGRGIAAVCGDASVAAVLVQAHVARARLLVIATPDAMAARRIIELARMLQPAIQTIVRTHSDEEAEWLRAERVDQVCIGEAELARGMLGEVLRRLRPPGATLT